ncbi:hypothetical protein ALC62_03424, partial [Cyphomyrmex costatus]
LFIQFHFYQAHAFCKYLYQCQFHRLLHFLSRYVFYTHEVSFENFLYATNVQRDLIPSGHEIISAAGMFGVQMATIGPC